MTERSQTARAAGRRRPFEAMERRLVRLAVQVGDADAETVRLVNGLRYALSFAKLTTLRNGDGAELDLYGIQGAHAARVREHMEPHLPARGNSLHDALKAAPEVIAWTVTARESLLAHLDVDRAALEREVTTRSLVIASGGGGGAGYGYPGTYDMLDRIGLVPDLLVGTSIGALMSIFRAKRRRFDLAALVSAARALSWTKVFRALESESRYGLPATLRLYLRDALGAMFTAPDGRALWLSDLEIPFYSVATGITVDALKHDLAYYENFLGNDVSSTSARSMSSGVKAMTLLRDFLARPEALREIVLGRAEGTEDFDVLDAAGFSAAIPGVIHYDVLRDDPRMKHILDDLYASYGITRLGEGGMVSNVPARVAWETAAEGRIADGRRNAFVIALDCFAPSPGRPAWLLFQHAVRQANVNRDRVYADLYLPYPKTLSPLNLVPNITDAMQAIRWGREATEPHLAWVRKMMDPIPPLVCGDDADNT